MTPRRKPEPSRAVGYIRVSSDQQAESGLSLEHQREKVRAAATLHDLDLIDVIIDAAESAATLDRPGMHRMLELVRAKKVDTVIVLKLDRLTRNVRDLADLLESFRRGKVALMSVAESLNTETAAGRMVVNMLGVIAQWEREAIGERTSAALSAKRSRGERAGTIPYGFALAADGSRLKANERERRTLRVMLECREAGYSLRDIAEELNRNGLTTRAGQPWRFEYVRSALKTIDRHPAVEVV
jgi:site-specific DNA recombinase